MADILERIVEGEGPRFASEARCGTERPAMDGRAGIIQNTNVAPWMAAAQSRN